RIKGPALTSAGARLRERLFATLYSAPRSVAELSDAISAPCGMCCSASWRCPRPDPFMFRPRPPGSGAACTFTRLEHSGSAVLAHRAGRRRFSYAAFGPGCDGVEDWHEISFRPTPRGAAETA